MADTAVSKIDAAAEKAYAEAAAAKRDTKGEEAKPASPAKKAATKKIAAKKAVKKAPAKKAAAKKPTAKKTAAKKTARKVAKKVTAQKQATKKAPKKTPKQNGAATKAANPINSIKDTIMAKAKNTDFTQSAKEAAAEFQSRAQTAFAKTSTLAGEAVEFNKGNLEALVESGKTLYAGMQELSREQVATGRDVVETVRGDVKKLAAVKSPSELLQLQGELARRNFDAVVAYGSQRSEKLVKLYSDVFAPISTRVSLAAEKIRKAA